MQEGKEKGVEYFEFYFNQTNIPWYENKAIDRRQIVTINRMRSNHYSLAASLARKNIISDPSCTLCGSDHQDLDHVV